MPLGRFPARAVWRRHYRALVGCACAALAALLGIYGPDATQLDGRIFDVMVAQRNDLAPRVVDVAAEPAVVVAVDQGSMEADELAGLPRVLFSPYWAQLIDALDTADAKAIGFDVIFAWAADAMQPGMDTPLLEAIARLPDKVAIVRSSRTSPAPPFFYAAGGGEDPHRLPLAELNPDGDGVIRTVAPWVVTSEGPWPTLSGALIARAGGTPGPEVLLAPRWPAESVPTYAMIDVLRCAKANPQRLHDAFAGRIVLIGTTLPDEDRKITTDRFVHRRPPLPASPATDGCALRLMPPSDPHSQTVPGVHVHALAIRAAVTGDFPVLAAQSFRAAINALVAAVIAILALPLGVTRALIWVAITELLVYLAASALLFINVYLPVTMPMAAGGGTLLVSLTTRYVLEEKRRQRVQRAFGHYLAPKLVQTMLEDDTPLRLGGETRQVSVMFADLTGFTEVSGHLSPEQLMALVNRYLGIIVEAVEASGGYIDKFIGDGVMAFWGAPANDPDHAVHAVDGAIAAAEAVVRAAREDADAGRPGFKVKIGINTGEAVIGNVGARGRFNYTAIGECVNVSARLESAAGDYAYGVLLGPATAQAVAGRFILCELDRILVRGVDIPLAIYRPLRLDDATAVEWAEGYAKALANYRAGQFAAASAAWADLMAGPHRDLARVMYERSLAYETTPPPPDWDGVWVRKTK